MMTVVYKKMQPHHDGSWSWLHERWNFDSVTVFSLDQMKTRMTWLFHLLRSRRWSSLLTPSLCHSYELYWIRFLSTLLELLYFSFFFFLEPKVRAIIILSYVIMIVRVIHESLSITTRSHAMNQSCSSNIYIHIINLKWHPHNLLMMD